MGYSAIASLQCLVFLTHSAHRMHIHYFNCNIGLTLGYCELQSADLGYIQA